MPHQLQVPSPLPNPRNTSEWESIPTTKWPGLEKGAETATLLPAKRVQTQSTYSRADPTQLNASQQTTDEGPLGGELVFQAPLTSESFQVLEPLPYSEEPLFCPRLLRLYDLPGTDLYQTTRRLVFLRSAGEDASSAGRQEFWMPLADIAVVRRGGSVIISWSDCNHHESHAAVNGMTLHSRVYMRMKPNNTLLIHFATPSGARDFATQISEPRIPKTDLITWPVNLYPYATSSAWAFDTAGNYHKYSVSPEVMYTVQAFDCHAVKPNEPSRGLLVRARDDLTTSTSRIYWLPRTIDIVLALDSGSKPSVSLMDVLAAGYQSNIRRVHNSGIDQVGVCQDVELSACSVSLRFETPHGEYHHRRDIWAQVLIVLQRGTTFSMALPSGLCDNVRRSSVFGRCVNLLARKNTAKQTFCSGGTKRAMPSLHSDLKEGLPAQENGSQDIVSSSRITL
jgi:hypothetical protein